MPMASFMPKRVIMLRAMAVARSMSLAAPEVQVLNISSSAARPATSTCSCWMRSSFFISTRSSSSACMVKPSAPEVRGMMVILRIGMAFFWRAATRAWPISW